VGIVRIASGNSDQNVRLWDATASKQLGALFRGHEDGAVSLAFTPDANCIGRGLARAGPTRSDPRDHSPTPIAPPEAAPVRSAAPVCRQTPMPGLDQPQAR
jgi:hypothetical protein